mgnify:CR=1 FL=1
MEPIVDNASGDHIIFNHQLDLTIDWNADVIPHKGEVNLAFRIDRASTLDERGSVLIGPSTGLNLTNQRRYVNKFSDYFLESNANTSLKMK